MYKISILYVFVVFYDGFNIYSITCIQRPPKGNHKSGLLQQVVFKYRFY